MYSKLRLNLVYVLDYKDKKLLTSTTQQPFNKKIRKRKERKKGRRETKRVMEMEKPPIL